MRIFAAVVLATLASHSLSSAQTVISDVPSCPSCKINVLTITRLGDAEGPGSFARQPRTVMVDSKGRYWVATGDLPLVFGPDGRFQSSPARKGSGPGELPSYGVPLAALPGDSVLVDGGDRILIFDGMLRAARSIVAPVGLRTIAAVHWPRLIFASASVPSRQLIGFPIHTLDFSKPTLQVLQSGSPTGERLNPFSEEIHERVVANNNELWSVARSSYRLVRWDSQLKRTATLLRRPRWWREPSKNLLGNKTTAPQHYVAPLTLTKAA